MYQIICYIILIYVHVKNLFYFDISKKYMLLCIILYAIMPVI